MTRPGRVAQYIQQLAYETLSSQDERDERPQDVPPASDSSPNYPSWNATSFSVYVPFSSPTNG
jgi:hypothetical protein